MRGRAGPRPCDKLRKTGNESHSTPIRALHYRLRADAMAGIPAHADAWRADRRERARAVRRRGRPMPATPSPCTASRPGRPTSTIRRYANPAAPKGGQLVQGVLGTFDSLNPFIVKGLPAVNIRSYVIESLLARGYDEPFTLYGLLADSVETDAARSYVTFTLNPAARFADGKPVTPDDVIFSWQLAARPRPAELPHLLRQGGQGARRSTRARCASILTGSDDRELPLIIGLMPVLAKHAIDPAKFEETTFEPLLGSGPYKVSAVKPGESVTFTRDRELLGPRSADQPRLLEFRHHPLRLLPRRQHAFRGLQERPLRRAQRNRSRPLADRLRFPGIARRPRGQGGIPLRPAQGHGRPGVQHAPADLRRRARARGDPASVRFRMDQPHLFLRSLQAHRELFRRLRSVRARRAADARERELLAPFPGVVRADIMDGTWAPPVTDGSGRDRAGLRKAFALFAAGRLRAQRHATGAHGERPAVRLRNPHHHPRPGARWRSPSCAASSAPASTRTCAASTPPSSSAGASPSIST